jgi:preprotein translocase subunit SecG
MLLLINFLLALEVIVGLLMILVILMQRPKSEGLGAAFGGGVTENIFGAQTTNVLTTVTAWLAGIFFLLTLVLSILYAHKGASSSAVRRELMKTKAAAATSAASPASPQSPAAAALTTPGISPVQTPGPVRPEDAAAGVIPPASAPLAPSATPAGSVKPKL